MFLASHSWRPYLFHMGTNKMSCSFKHQRGGQDFSKVVFNNSVVLLMQEPEGALVSILK